MDWYWTWGGDCFGYRRDDRLFAYHGLQVGNFHDKEIYGANGQYLGEEINGNRLITQISKKGWAKFGFGPTQSGSYARYASYAGYAMYAGCEDFPSPDTFRRS